MTSKERLNKFGVALLASRISVLGEDSCGGSEVVLWEDAAILRDAGIPVRVYASAACNRGSVNILPLRTGTPQIASLEYVGQLLLKERKALLLAYNEPAVAGCAPHRTIVRFDWTTPLPRYWNWPMWLPRFRRARYLFPSESERHVFLQEHGCVLEPNTIVLPNAVDLQLFRPINDGKTDRAPEGLRVGYAGQWSAGKGIPELLKAWRIVRSVVPAAELSMAGGPKLWKSVATVPQAEESTRLVREMEEQGLLHSVGTLERSQMPAFWRSLDVAVMPSLSESFGLVALEALACGVPVVSTTAGGLKEIAVDEESGLFVPPGDAEALAQALLRLLTDDSLRLRLTQGARRRAQAFSLERRSRQLLHLIFELAEKTR
jgi:glycosyltransferase involved in cell wall biosynthesis